MNVHDPHLQHASRDHYDRGGRHLSCISTAWRALGEIVSFMGFAMLLIGRLETAASFVSSLFFKRKWGAENTLP